MDMVKRVKDIKLSGECKIKGFASRRNTSVGVYGLDGAIDTIANRKVFSQSIANARLFFPIGSFREDMWKIYFFCLILECKKRGNFCNDL